MWNVAAVVWLVDHKKFRPLQLGVAYFRPLTKKAQRLYPESPSYHYSSSSYAERRSCCLTDGSYS